MADPTSRLLSLLTGVKPLLGFLPVHHVPPGVEVIRAAVLILEVIGVLPHIHADHRKLSFHHRRILIRGRRDFNARTGLQKPGPSGPEPAYPGSIEFFLERIEASESRVDGRGEVAHWRPAFARSHNLPEHRVVDV